jgi:hypothetical protein
MDDIQVVHIVYIEHCSFSRTTMGVFFDKNLAHLQILEWKKQYPSTVFSVSSWPVMDTLIKR